MSDFIPNGGYDALMRHCSESPVNKYPNTANALIGILIGDGILKKDASDLGQTLYDAGYRVSRLGPRISEYGYESGTICFHNNATRETHTFEVKKGSIVRINGDPRNQYAQEYFAALTCTVFS